MIQLNIVLDEAYFHEHRHVPLLLSPRIIAGLRFKMNIKDCEKDLVTTLHILNLHPEKIIKPKRHDIQCHFPPKITTILMGILTDFPASISEQAKLAYVRLRSIKCSHGKISFSLFLPLLL